MLKKYEAKDKGKNSQLILGQYTPKYRVQPQDQKTCIFSVLNSVSPSLTPPSTEVGLPNTYCAKAHEGSSRTPNGSYRRDYKRERLYDNLTLTLLWDFKFTN